jgi:ATP-dependent DNA helicase DinG
VAILMLKQGLGRLIRSAADRGILAVLDSRLVEKSYGRRFLDSLPPARRVHDVEEVARFLGVTKREREGSVPSPAVPAGGARGSRRRSR